MPTVISAPSSSLFSLLFPFRTLRSLQFWIRFSLPQIGCSRRIYLKTLPKHWKTFTFKTHSCLEKLRLVANADNLKVPQFPKAQVYRLPIQVPGFPPETSIFPPKSFPLPQSRTPFPLPPSITVKEKLISPSSSSSSSSSQPALLLPSTYGESKAQLLILITIPSCSLIYSFHKVLPCQ